jgi:pimeloyl-ACP methyl ester carboxylesterase
MPIPRGQSAANVQCGVLTVPEDRSETGGRTIKLPVAVLKATGANKKPDPFVFINGGPGQPTLAGAVPLQAFTAEFAGPLQAQRDLVFFDQRGTGLFQPSLDCPEWRAEYYSALAEATNLTTNGLFRCIDRLSAAGVNFGGYNSAEIAADISDLMKALGYTEWNLYGWSYGTRVALTAMRDKPDGIRSVILDATVPLQADLVTSDSRQQSLNVLFAECRADPACLAAYPSLELSTVANLSRQLDQTPMTLQLRDPASGADVTATVDGGWFNEIVFLALYDVQDISLLPNTIVATAQGETAALKKLTEASLFDFDDGADGMYMSVMCNEEFMFSGRATEREICRRLGVGEPDANENQAVTSNVPTLILSGNYDPVTPPRYGMQAAESLTRSYFFELNGTSHGAFMNSAALDGHITESHRCVARIVVAFLNRPQEKPNEACVDSLRLPAFLVP